IYTLSLHDALPIFDELPRDLVRGDAHAHLLPRVVQGREQKGDRPRRVAIEELRREGRDTGDSGDLLHVREVIAEGFPTGPALDLDQALDGTGDQRARPEAVDGL